VDVSDAQRRQESIGRSYLDHLSDADLGLLIRAGGSGTGAVTAVSTARSQPHMVESLLANGRAFDALFGQQEGDDTLLGASPFLTFALAVHRGLHELQGSTMVEEWIGPGRRIPVLGVEDLRTFLSDPARRLFLTELLASYTHVASGSVWTRTRRGWRRRRFSELDPVRLASLLEVVPEAERTWVYRRLGDLSLFLTGIFPDHTATHGFGQLDEGRLLRAARLGERSQHVAQPPAEPVLDLGAVGLLEHLGERWYRMACSVALSPGTATMEVVADVAGRFRQARRILNFITDRYLFPFRSSWFGVPSA
jgi:hypothetical protein